MSILLYNSYTCDNQGGKCLRESGKVIKLFKWEVEGMLFKELKIRDKVGIHSTLTLVITGYLGVLS